MLYIKESVYIDIELKWRTVHKRSHLTSLTRMWANGQWKSFRTQTDCIEPVIRWLDSILYEQLHIFALRSSYTFCKPLFGETCYSDAAKEKVNICRMLNTSIVCLLLGYANAALSSACVTSLVYLNCHRLIQPIRTCGTHVRIMQAAHHIYMYYIFWTVKHL